MQYRDHSGVHTRMMAADRCADVYYGRESRTNKMEYTDHSGVHTRMMAADHTVVLA